MTTYRTPRELLEYLPARLIVILAGLHGASTRVAEATVQLLPFGSRAALEAADMAVGRDVKGVRVLTLTPLAYEVMAEAAVQRSGKHEVLATLESQAWEATKGLSVHHH